MVLCRRYTSVEPFRLFLFKFLLLGRILPPPDLDVGLALSYLFSEYTCIKQVEQNIPNVSISRNLGISHAKLNYVSLIDDDDLWLDERARILLQAVGINSNSIVFGSALFVDERTHKVRYRIYQQQVNRSDVLKQFSRPLFLKQKYFFVYQKFLFVLILSFLYLLL